MKYNSPLTSISPIDGRYQSKVQELKHLCSEYGLMYFRVIVEIKWLKALSENSQIKEVPLFSEESNKLLDDIIENFDESDAERIKIIESETNHDVKSIEYFVKEKISNNEELNKIKEFVHFACTSEDITNLAYGLMIKNVSDKCLAHNIKEIINILTELSHKYASYSMLSHTHGQPASPTTMGKELANFTYRLKRQYKQFLNHEITGKLNGSVGNYNAHSIAYPELDWIDISKNFVESLGLVFNPYTTQIEPHDSLAELFQTLMRFNLILMDLSRDIWEYISLGYFKQKLKQNEVGSSVMPHKVNPIDFENAEGNLGIANSLFDHFSQKLLISRMQRDLTDSTVLRNIGVAFAHSLISYKSILKGLNKLEINENRLNEDLEKNWAILAEAIQTVMRRYGIEDPYEKLKSLTRGKKIDKKTLNEFIDTLDLPNQVKTELKQLTTRTYLGQAIELSRRI